MENKYRIRKTGEIVEVISYGGSTTRSDVLDFVSYIDSKGVEHEKEPLNLYWDLERVENPNTNDNFNRIIEMHTESERRRVAAQALQGIISNGTMINTIAKGIVECGEELSVNSIVTSIAQCAVAYADALIAELDKKKDENE